MLITKIELGQKNAYKIYIDDHFAFRLYKSEVARFKLQEGMPLSQELSQEIHKTMCTRAKKKAMSLLEIKWRTEKELCDRLGQQFPPEVTQEAISYVKSYGYIDDRRYIQQYLFCRSAQKSRAELKSYLLLAGLSKDLIAEEMSQFYMQHSEAEAINVLLKKRKFRAADASDADKKKIMNYLGRKGFNYGDICRALSIDED